MTLLARSQVRFLLRVPWSALAALIGVTLGVTSVVAVHQISTGVDNTLRETVPPHLTEVTHLLTREGLDAEAYFALRKRWRDGEFEGVRAMLPIVEGQLVLDSGATQIIGADWLALMDLARSERGPSAGAASAGLPGLAMVAGGEVVVDAALGLAAGEVIDLNGEDHPVAAVVAAGMGPAIFADIAVAQSALELPPDALSYIGLSIHDPLRALRLRLEQLMPGISAALPGPVAPEGLAAAWQVQPVSRELPSASFARSVLFNLGALGTLALLVAWFLIYQVAVIWLRRQHLLISRLAVLGVRPGELLRSFLPGFFAFGLAATLLGLVSGQGLAALLLKVTAAGMPQSEGLPALDVWVAGKAALSGLGICLIGGWAAFRRETVGVWRERRRRGWLRAPLAAGLMLLAVFGAAVDASGLPGGFLSILALSLLGVMGVAALLAGFRRLSGRFGGALLVRMGLREAAWYPRVVGVALAALALAVATSIAIGLMVESFRLDFSRMLETRLAGDLYVRGAPAVLEDAQRWLQANAKVREIRGYGSSRQRVGGQPVELVVGQYDAWEMRRYGYHGSLGDRGIMISQRLARDLGVSVGDALSLDTGPVGPGRVPLVVVHLFPGFGDPVPRAMLDVSAAADLGLPASVDRLTLDGVSGSDLAASLSRRFPDLRIEPRAGVRAVALTIFDRTFAVTQALTLLALTVAVVGMYSALTALRLNQAPTLRLLAHQGVTTAELRAVALLRSATMGVLALLLALPLGLVMAWVLCEVINPRAFGWSVQLQLPASGLVPPLVLGLLAAVLSGLLPAPREQGDLDDGN